MDYESILCSFYERRYFYGSSKEPQDPQDELTNPGNTQEKEDSDPETETDRDTLEKSW